MEEGLARRPGPFSIRVGIESAAVGKSLAKYFGIGMVGLDIFFQRLRIILTVLDVFFLILGMTKIINPGRNRKENQGDAKDFHESGFARRHE